MSGILAVSVGGVSPTGVGVVIVVSDFGPMKTKVLKLAMVGKMPSAKR